MVYQDHLTKFVQLRPLKTKRAEVACHVLSIFLPFGAPAILQSDNGREFSNQVMSEVCAMWKDVKIVHGVELILTSHCSATRGLLATDHVILNHGQVTWTTPELAPPSPNYHTTPTGGRFSSRQI
ncbi:KRAB-A domain-containing protein 2 [Trichonephila clavipes]|nr:KRAB-A domain-containing protein 2 [Trichonephila clavipes]